jgi:hypothetical protein
VSLKLAADSGRGGGVHLLHQRADYRMAEGEHDAIHTSARQEACGLRDDGDISSDYRDHSRGDFSRKRSSQVHHPITLLRRASKVGTGCVENIESWEGLGPVLLLTMIDMICRLKDTWQSTRLSCLASAQTRMLYRRDEPGLLSMGHVPAARPKSTRSALPRNKNRMVVSCRLV